jgi:hypothetical protein
MSFCKDCVSGPYTVFFSFSELALLSCLPTQALSMKVLVLLKVKSVLCTWEIYLLTQISFRNLGGVRWREMLCRHSKDGLPQGQGNLVPC